MYMSRDVGVCVNDCLRLTNFHLLSDIAMTKKKLNISILVLKEILKQALFKLQINQCSNEYSNIFEYFPKNVDICIQLVVILKAEYILEYFSQIFLNIGL